MDLMEPPTPNEFGNILSKEILKAEKNYKITSDKNNVFNIILRNFTSSIEINASYEDDYGKNEFIEKYKLLDLKENKFLSICETLDDIYEELIFELSKNKCKIIENKNQVNISIPINHAKYKELSFTLNKKIKSDKENIQELYKLVFNLQTQIKGIDKEKDKENTEKINMCNKEINDLKQVIININQYNKQLEQKVESLEKEILDLKKQINPLVNNNLIKQNTLLDFKYEEIENPWNKNEKDQDPSGKEYTFKLNDYYAEKKSSFLRLIVSRHKFEKNKIYKLKYDIIYNGKRFRVGFGYATVLNNRLEEKGSVGLTNEGLYIEGKKFSNIKLKKGNITVTFIINLKENPNNFEVIMDEISFGKYNFELDNIYGLAAFEDGSIKISTYRDIN